MLTRFLIAFVALFLLAGHARAQQACGTDTPPAIAAANGLTCEVFVDTFTNTNSIDTADTRNPGSCPLATFPNGVCHWFVHNAWPAFAAPGLGGFPQGVNLTNMPPTMPVDYSVSSSGITLQPQVLTVTASTVNGSNQLTGISNTSGVITGGSATVVGPGIPVATTFTLSGTTATMSNAATSTNTAASYQLGNIHNGWMLQSCVFNPNAGGFAGTTFTGNYYIQVDAAFSTSAPTNWNVIQSEAEAWMWPLEIFTPGVTGNLLNTGEIDFFDAPNGRVFWFIGTQSGGLSFLESDNFGGPYYGFGPIAYGGTPFGTLVRSPSSNAGGTGLGLASFDNGGAAVQSMTFGPSAVPTSTPSGAISGTSVSGAFTPFMSGNHFCLQLDASPFWPMTVHKVAVWMAPVVNGGGRRGAFR
jgi:hypothetical protein